MDISTLLTSQSAPAQGALSIGGGQLGGSRVSGAEGEDAVDRFNQLLSNFLSITGEDGLALQGDADIEGAGLNGLTLTGMATEANGTGVTIAVPQGLRNLALTGAGGKAGTVDGRWAQAGLNLLAAGGLQGQELNEEVVAFLNDLSTALGGQNALTSAEGEIALAGTAAEDGQTSIADALTLLQGDGAVPALSTSVSPSATTSISVIPQLQANAAPSALGVPMPADGTGAALDTVPEGDAQPATPVTVAKVIPKLEKLPEASVQTSMNTGIVGPRLTPPAAGAATSDGSAAIPADSLSPSQMAPATAFATDAAVAVATETAAAGPAVAAPDTPAPAPSVKPATAADPQPQGAIAVPEGMQTVTDAVKVAVPKPADMSATTSAATGSTANMPVTKAQSLTAPEAPALTEQTTAAEAAPTPTAASASQPETAADQASLTAPMTEKAPLEQKVANPPSSAAPAVKTTAASAVKAPTAGATAAADIDNAASGEQTATLATDNAASGKDAVKLTVTTTQAAPARPEKSTMKAAASTVPAQAPSTETADVTAEPVAVAEDDSPTEAKGSTRKAASTPKEQTAEKDRPADTLTADDMSAAEPAVSTEPAAEDDGVTNRRMLAPKHVKEGADGQARAELAGAAQTAGQNVTNPRPDPLQAASLSAAVRSDSLLTRAVTAAAKAEGGGTATDGSALPAADSTGTEQASLAMASMDSGKPGATDFAQSLRQAGTPHRPTAYTPPAMQVAVQVQQAAEDGNDRVSIQLTPHDLGKIEVQLEFGAGGKLRAKVMAENPQTLEMLQKDAKGLEKALQDAGLNTDANSLSFSLQQDNGDQAQQRQRDQEGSNYGTALASDDVEEEDPAIIAQAQIMELGRVDVRV